MHIIKKIIIAVFLVIITVNLTLIAFMIRDKKSPDIDFVKSGSDNAFKTELDISNEAGYFILINKEEHKLYLYNKDKIIKNYDVNLRNQFDDRKVWEDDQTPEGIFTIETINKVTNGWERWMRLDTTAKAREIYVKYHKDGFKRIADFEKVYGLIKGDSDIRIFNSKNSGQKMLRGIGIHGGGYSPGNDWTIGCIATDNKNIIDLYDILTGLDSGGINMKVYIQD